MNPWPIAPISPRDLDFSVVNYCFASFTANEETELPGLETAIDLTLLDFATSIADQTLLIADLFTGMDDVGLISGEIDSSDDVGQTLSDLSNSAAAADATLGDYNGQIGDNSGGSSTPTTIPIQHATGPVLPCEARQGMGPGGCGSYPCSTVEQFVNIHKQVMHISSIVLVQAAPPPPQPLSANSLIAPPPGGFRLTGPFSATTDCTGILQPGEGCRFTITLQTAPPPGAKAQLQFYHDQPGSPDVFCVDDGIGSSGIGGGGGGGGGPIKSAGT